MAGVVRHGSDGVFALDMARDDLKSVPISSPQQGSQVDERALNRCSGNQRPLPGGDTREPVYSGITAWSESLARDRSPKEPV